jgi:hypothetical protein
MVATRRDGPEEQYLADRTEVVFINLLFVLGFLSQVRRVRLSIHLVCSIAALLP